MPGSGKVIMTGSLGEVMQESARAAVSFTRHHVDEFKIDPDFCRENVERIVVSEKKEGEDYVYWKNYPGVTKCPHDDNAHHYVPLPGQHPEPSEVDAFVKDNDMRVRPEIDDVDPDQVFYDDFESMIRAVLEFVEDTLSAGDAAVG